MSGLLLDLCVVGLFVGVLMGGWVWLAWAAGVSIDTYAGELERNRGGRGS